MHRKLLSQRVYYLDYLSLFNMLVSRYEEVCGYASGVILSRRRRSSPVELTSCGEILRRSAPRKRDLRPQDEIQDPGKHTPTCLAAVLASGAAALGVGLVGRWKTRGRSAWLWFASAVPVLLVGVLLIFG